MNDDRVPISPQLPAVFETAPSAFPQGPAPHQTFGDSSVPDVSAFNDLSASNNPDILESFDFETFLNTDGDEAGFNFGLNLPFAPEEAPKVEDTSPENPDVWILRWTTLEKTELHHLDPIDAPGL
ncbi:hypothetical protein N7532_011555 [Penicillium argentinense]|uniref:Uncharacterized protein n=1 Tax=Penicillium argentinense TaxID=1131581 RepID=A0A9W9EIM1_9EURO|nr:uncharacterized protein N7532_011555 [Penicillium argentinense]KAJ5082512.1 hypothetical protein N7532_011555 [Penicillium argentinense]